jgi:hypothetical protein
MKKRICIVLFLAAWMAFPAFGLAGDPDQAKPQAQVQVSQARLLLRPDLAMGRIWIVKAGLTTVAVPPQPVTVLKKGQKYLFYCQYSNPGRLLHGFWKLGYYVDGEMFWNQYWGDVPAGATQTKYVEYTPTAIGSHTYSCRLDYDKEVVETDETNNKSSIGFTVIL